eukprot:14782710-Ditylum_brightwellii.AAC.1
MAASGTKLTISTVVAVAIVVILDVVIYFVAFVCIHALFWGTHILDKIGDWGCGGCSNCCCYGGYVDENGGPCFGNETVGRSSFFCRY